MIKKNDYLYFYIFNKMFNDKIDPIIELLKHNNFTNFDYIDYIDTIYYKYYYIINSYLIIFTFTIINNIYLFIILSCYFTKIVKKLDNKLNEIKEIINNNNINIYTDIDNIRKKKIIISDSDSDIDSDSDSDNNNNFTIRRRNPKRKCRFS